MTTLFICWWFCGLVIWAGFHWSQWYGYNFLNNQKKKKNRAPNGKTRVGFQALCHIKGQLIGQIKSHSQVHSCRMRGKLLLKCQRSDLLRPSSHCCGQLRKQFTEAPHYWGHLDSSFTLCHWGFLSGYHAWLCKPLDGPSSPSPSHDHRSKKEMMSRKDCPGTPCLSCNVL